MSGPSTCTLSGLGIGWDFSLKGRKQVQNLSTGIFKQIGQFAEAIIPAASSNYQSGRAMLPVITLRSLTTASLKILSYEMQK